MAQSPLYIAKQILGKEESDYILSTLIGEYYRQVEIHLSMKIINEKLKTNIKSTDSVEKGIELIKEKWYSEYWPTTRKLLKEKVKKQRFC